MTDPDGVVLPLHCPNCHHDGAWLHIRSVSVLTVKCSECNHTWSMDIDTVSSDIRGQVTAAEGVPK
jgi:hypothetical protein